MSGKERIGIFGGTFNPIHYGHLLIAEAVREEYNLDYIIFVPCANPPHKSNNVVSAKDRYHMTALAIEDNPYFLISDIELRRNDYSYTIHTMRHFKALYGEDTEFYFIAGTDTIHQLPGWKYIWELLEICHFVGASRPDGTEVIDSVIKFFGDLGKEKIHKMRTLELELSSTDIRERFCAGHSVRYMLPPIVTAYIKSHNIYPLCSKK